MPRRVLLHFVGMKSLNAPYRVFRPLHETIKTCRVREYTPVRNETELSSFSSVVSDMSRHTELAEMGEVEHDGEVKSFMTRSFFVHFCQVRNALKYKTIDRRFPISLEEAFNVRPWAEAIGSNLMPS